MENSQEQNKKSGFVHVIKEIFGWTYRLRGIALAIPVIIAAISLALHNARKLPDQVGLIIQPDGQYAEMISKNTAVMGPLAITAVCLLMMFCSKKTLYPWIISIFSLVLPLLIYFTNTFPG